MECVMNLDDEVPGHTAKRWWLGNPGEPLPRRPSVTRSILDLGYSITPFRLTGRRIDSTT